MSATTKNQLQDTNNDYVYDAAGNLIQPGPIGGPYVFDAENHLIAAGGMAYPRLGTKEPGRISLLTRHSPLATRHCSFPSHETRKFPPTPSILFTYFVSIRMINL